MAIDQSSDFQTGIGVAAYPTMDTEQLISHTRTAVVDTIASLQDWEGNVIAASEVHELLTKIHDILDNTVPKWVGNTTHILACLFNSVLRQQCEVWGFQFPFLHNLKDFVPHSEACLYGCINWALEQAHHQSFIGPSQSSTSMRGARAKSRAVLQCTTQKWSVLEPGCAFLPKKPHFDSGLRVIRVAESPQKVHQLVPWTLRRRRSAGVVCLRSYSLHHLHLLCRLVPFLHSWISGQAKYPIGL